MGAMQISAQVAKGQLTVDVQLRNQLDEPIYLQHWLMDWYGLLGIPEMHAGKNRKTARFTRELAYVCTGAPGEVVLLNGDGPSPALVVGSQGVLQPRLMPTVPRLPESSRLLPNAELKWAIKLPLPLCEWFAYEPPVATPTRAVQVHTLRYRLDFIRKSKLRSEPTEFVNFPGIFQARGDSESVAAVTTLATPITVQQRTDPFQRFA